MTKQQKELWGKLIDRSKLFHDHPSTWNFVLLKKTLNDYREQHSPSVAFASIVFFGFSVVLWETIRMIFG